MTDTISNDRMHQADEATKLERAALRPEELLPINVDIPTTVTNVIGSLPEILAVQQEIVDNITHFGITNITKLETLALATAHAQGIYMLAAAPTPGLVELNEHGVTLRDMFMADGTAMAKRGLVAADRLAEVKGLTGYRNVAFDLIALTGLFRESWSKIEGRTTVQWAELDEARALADKLIAGVGARDQAPAAMSSAIDHRLRAFTLLARAYDEVRAAVLYVRRHKGDADQIAPSLYAGRTKSKKTDAQPSAPATSAPVASPTPASPAVPEVEPGMPGASPFINP